ncbi:hypothetical protein CLAIMM_01110 [Cladophialophora immunda]|nr:hypothetical protein CLAIMM_01110 [Cladophialophora immunda]
MDPGELRARKDRFRIIVTIFVTELRALAASHLASPPESWDTDGALNKRFAWFLCGTLPEVLVDVICSTVTDATQFVIGKDRQGNPLRAAHFRFLPRVSRQDSQWGAYFDSLVNKITGEWMLYGGSAVGRRGLIGRELVYLLHSDTNGRHPKLLADPNWDPWICISADFSALAGLHAAYVRVVEDFLMTASPALSTEGPTFRWMTRQAKEFTNLVRQKMGLTLLPEEACNMATPLKQGFPADRRFGTLQRCSNPVASCPNTSETHAKGNFVPLIRGRLLDLDSRLCGTCHSYFRKHGSPSRESGHPLYYPSRQPRLNENSSNQ